MDMQDILNGDGSMGDANDPIPVVPLARLTKCPLSLYDLWKDYEFDFHGCKVAKYWNALDWGGSN